MPQYYKRKADAKPRKKIDEERMKLAVLEAIQEGSKILTVAKKYDVDRMTLKRYVKRYTDNPDAKMTSNYKKKINIFEGKRRGTSRIFENVLKVKSWTYLCAYKKTCI